MNLVNELQISAEKDDVLTVLRKTKRLASKLGRQDISDWLQAEQNGYMVEQDVPKYRTITSHVVYNTNGYVPAGFGYVRDGIESVPGCSLSPPIPMRDSIGDVMVHIQHIDQNQSIYVPLGNGTDMDRLIRSYIVFNPEYPEYTERFSFLLKLNPAQVKAIPEKIKDRVLDWACNLEAAGVHEEGMSFSAEEKAFAHTTVFNIDRSTIDQLNAHGKNEKD